MRCLYCGKELALLKRWTGGGEFCSDAHRQQYQEEYNQLALNRLLQAKPPSEEKASGNQKSPANPPEEKKAEEPKKPEPAPRPRVEVAPPPPPISSPKPVVSTPVVEQKPAPVTAPVMVEEEEEPAPAELGGFLVEIPVPAEAEVAAMATVETEFEHATPPALPHWDPDPWGTQLVPASRVALSPSGRVLDWSAPRGERRLETRDLGHSAPVIDFKLALANGIGLTKISEEPMDFLVFPHPPQGSPPLWQEGEEEFKFEAELGILARLAFGTTGLQDNQEDTIVPAVSEELVEEVATPKQAAVSEPIIVEPPPPPAAPPHAATESKPAPLPAATVPSASTPKASFIRPPLIASKAPETVAAKPAEKSSEPSKPADKVPDLVKKPLPLTLHGLAAGRGKSVQIVSTPASSGIELQVPRSSAVPMRPVMVLGPAVPARPEEDKKQEEKKPEEKRPERTVVIKADPKKIQPVRIDPRIVNKGRKPEVRLPDVEKSNPEKKDVEKSIEKLVEKKESQSVAPAANAATKEPVAKSADVKKPPEAKSETPKAEPAKPEPAKAPKESPQFDRYAQPDLGLPSLSFQDSGNFWTRMPMPAKLGLAAGIVLAIIGVAVFGVKGGNGAAASTGPRVVAGQPLAAMSSGWITDWGTEPGVRRQHEISILRPSMNLTDYRLEFEAQIEAKAIGWVYRAQDAKNYYVSKLEIVKPGLEPTIALVRFAVINGEEQPRSQFPLKIPVRIDTLYKIRFDAVGDHFTTWVMDQQIDDWTDDHIKLGGVGLYNERGEQMSLRGSVNVVPLVLKK